MYRAILNQQDINLFKLSLPEIHELKQQTGFTCPHCKAPLQLKSGPKKRPHFSHLTVCQYQYHENESEGHFRAKTLLAHWLKNQGIEPQIEKPLPHIRRVADVYFEFRSQKYAFEVQKSAISEALFEERTRAYEDAGIRVLWIFIGEVRKKPHTLRINRTMGLNRKLPMMHLKLEEKRLTMMSNIIWVSTREIKAHQESHYLPHLKLETLLEIPDTAPNQGDWLDIKLEFRRRTWQRYMQGEKLLQQLCSQYRSNLSLLPAEVGWPIHRSGFRKNLFIWQGYALFAVMSYTLGDVFTMGQVIHKMKIPVPKEAVAQLRDYLNLLEEFGIVGKEGSTYEYLRAPLFYERLELAVIEDEKLARTALSPGESWTRQVG